MQQTMCEVCLTLDDISGHFTGYAKHSEMLGKVRTSSELLEKSSPSPSAVSRRWAIATYEVSTWSSCPSRVAPPYRCALSRAARRSVGDERRPPGDGDREQHADCCRVAT